MNMNTLAEAINVIHITLVGLQGALFLLKDAMNLMAFNNEFNNTKCY